MAKKKQAKRAAKPKATTSDIVGTKPQREHIPSRWRKHYARLVALRDQMRQRQSVLSRDAVEESPNFSLHMADAGTDTYDRDWALSMLSSEQNAVYEIDQALDRIRTGTYGVCELTGKPIEPRRLEAIPWARFSLEAEKQLEQSGQTKFARLGPREGVSRGSAAEEEEESEEGA